MKRTAVRACVGLAIVLALLWLRRDERPKPFFGTPFELSHPSSAATEKARGAPASPQDKVKEATAPARIPTLQPASLQVSSSLESSALREPIIAAIRTSGMNLDEKRVAIVRAIEASGRSEETWTAGAASSFDAWRRGMPEATRAGIELGAINCFKAGCLSEVHFRDEATSRAAATAFRGLATDNAQHGGRVQTPASARGGRTTAHWIMLRPEHTANVDEDDV